MNIGIISYNIPHKKTKDLINNLPNRYNVTVFQFPFTLRKNKKNINNDRPFQLIKKKEYKFKEKNFLNFLPIRDWSKASFQNFKEEAKNFEIKYFLLATSKIIPEYFLNDEFKFINCHPAKLPNSRGVDSFKLSILNKIELGNSLHIINKDIDSGHLLFFKKLKVYKNDNFSKVCNRMYKDEINLMSNFNKYLKFKKKINNKKFQISHKRIGKDINYKIDSIFKINKKYFY